MALILNIETSAKTCSAALGKDGKLISLKESVDEKYAHSEKLTTYIEQIFSAAKINLKDIDAVAVSKGPGSYTGLRIGVSTAKGLCFALNKPLIGVETLKALAAGFFASPLSPLSSGDGANVLFCPMLDARRMEVYCAIYNSSLHEIKKTSAEIMDENSFSGFLEKNTICFFGDGAEKCKEKIVHPKAKFISGIFPSAKNMVELSEQRFQNKQFEDIAYFEPVYLKEFVAVKS